MLHAIVLAALFAAVPQVDSVSIAEATTVAVHVSVLKHNISMSVEDVRPEQEFLPDKTACSGVVVYSKGTVEYIATARHCAETEAQLLLGVQIGDFTPTPTYVDFFDGDRGVVKHIYRAPYADLAILTVKSVRKHPYVFIHIGVRRGEDLFVFGMPNGKKWTYSRATSMQGDSELGPISEEMLPYQHDITLECPSCDGGDSGGAVFNKRGQVIGILVAGDDRFNVAVPAHHIKQALKGML